MMKVLATGGFVVFVAGVLYFFSGGQRPADEFRVPVGEAYAKLSRIDPPTKAGIQTWSAPQSISGNGKNKLVWTQSERKCNIGLAPIGESETKVTVFCDSVVAENDTVASMVHHGFRNRVIEAIDSTLTDRSYDSQKGAGQTAYRWPSDGVASVSIGQAKSDYNKMVGSAFQAHADIRKMESESRRDSQVASFDEGPSDSGGDSGGE